MKIEGEEKSLVQIAMLLKKARIKAQEMPCMCEEYITCGKHKIVDDIKKLETNIKDILLTF